MNEIQTDLGWLNSLLKANAARHRAVSSNLANAETEGYRPLRVEFEEELRQFIEDDGGFDAGAIRDLAPRIVKDEMADRVHIEQEVMDLMKNQLAFDTYSQVVSMKIGMLKAAITSRGK